MSTGWLRGVVKSVESGDTLVIAGNVARGPPPEKKITLASLIAPKLVRGAPITGGDQPWGAGRHRAGSGSATSQLSDQATSSSGRAPHLLQAPLPSLPAL
jgi:hypothetical protein